MPVTMTLSTVYDHILEQGVTLNIVRVHYVINATQT